MDLPDLTRIVETHVPVRSTDLAAYLDQLRRDVSGPLRALEESGALHWFSFVLHTTQQLTPPKDEAGYIVHLRLEPSAGLDVASFVRLLPRHFLDPHAVPPLSAIPPVEASSLPDGDWSYAWGVLGECSRWVLDLLEAHVTGPDVDAIVQYLHFITNPLLLGHQSVFLPQSRTF